jgi:hypothetical protein
MHCPRPTAAITFSLYRPQMISDELGVTRARRMVALVHSYYPQAWYTAGPLDEWPLVASGLVRRATQSLAAVIALRPGGFYSDAAVLTRTIFEHVTAFAWIAACPDERVRPWLKNDLRQRVAAHRELVQVGDGGLIAPEVIAQFEAYIGAVQDDLPKTAQQAKAADEHWSRILDGQPDWKARGGFSGMYRVTYRHTSKFAHPTAIGLHPHLTEFGRGIVVVGDEITDLDPSPFSFASSVLGMGLRVASIALGWPRLEQIDDIYGE